MQIAKWTPPELYSGVEQKDFIRRFTLAESLKTELRRQYANAVRRTTNVQEFLSRSRSFWPEYDSINQRLIPEDPVYSGSVGGKTLATTTDLWTLTVGAAAQVRILESFVGGEAASSSVLRMAVQRSTGGTTATTQTPEKANTRSPAATTQFAINWSVQPTLSGNPFLFHAFNAFGGTDRWVPQPGEEIYLVNSEQLSARSASGTPVVSGYVIWEEM